MERIEHYDDYRRFLGDWFEDRKTRFSFFSNRYFCQKAEIKSPSLFSEVVKGHRNLTDQTIPKFIKGMGLTDSDAAFFTILVHLNQSQDPKERDLYMGELRRFRDKVVKEVIPAEHYEYYSRWYHPVVRELACIVDWGDDFERLASLVEPPLKVRETKDCIAMLLRLGFLTRDADGRYHQRAPLISSGNHIHAAGVRNLNKSFAEMASGAVDKYSPKERHISSMTLGVSADAYRRIEQEIDEFRDRIRRIVFDDKDSAQVYTLNVQLFPLTRKQEE